jgi:uncharacterized protein YndB with AHSA1/START domain
MKSKLITRRDFSLRLATFVSGLGAAGTAWAAAADPAATPATEKSEVSRTREAIHQEVVLPATPARVYPVLTETDQFDQIVRLSGAMKDMPHGAPATAISPDVGGAFTIFGGVISGRHLELSPGVRLVQAWRVAYWPPGIFSVVIFELKAEGAGSRVVFDHVGFPQGAGDSLASGWKAHYWEPLAKYLA